MVSAGNGTSAVRAAGGTAAPVVGEPALLRSIPGEVAEDWQTGIQAGDSVAAVDSLCSMCSERSGVVSEGSGFGS